VSHVVKIQSQVKSREAVEAACHRLELPAPHEGKHRLFTTSASGLAVQLPGWHYPVVFDTATAEARFDNYGGAWGKQEELNRFMQAYGVEVAKLEARKKGYTVKEQPLDNGSIKVTVQIGGAA
jgi:hypothetical protein